MEIFPLTQYNVCRRIPRDVLETVYGINLPKPEEWEDSDRPPHAEELLDAYGCKLLYF
jgi:large subunit GTPase 1